MLCPGCNKFAAYDTSTEPEAEDLNIDDDGNVSGTVRIVLTSECCGDELKEATFEIEESFVDEIEQFRETRHLEEGEDLEMEVELINGEVTDRYETKDRHGKPIRNTRYQKRFFGFSGTLSVTVSDPDHDAITETFEHDCSDEVQASGMDELV